MERAAAESKWHELHEDEPWHDGTFTSWAADRSSRHPYHFTAGVNVWVADEDAAPDDNFLSDVNAKP